MFRTESTKVLSIESAAAHLHSGGLLIYPTETAYAIGCDATNPVALRAIFRLKRRERGKPLPLIVASRAMAEYYARFTPLARRLAVRYWPGPLTIVLASRFSPLPVRRGSVRGRAALAPSTIAANGTIALRVSSHPIARALSRSLGRPIVSTSANRAGASPCYSARAALRSLRGGVRAVDTGPLPHRRPSTIVDARGDRPIVLRRGSIRV